MTQKTIKRLASSVLDVGESKIWIDPSSLEKVSEALTRDDVRALIKEGKIKAKPTRGVCRVRARLKQAGKKKGRHRGHGSRKGTRLARNNPKEQWIAKTRAQRSILRLISDDNAIDKTARKQVYLKIKGNAFKGKKNLVNYLVENKIVDEVSINKALNKKGAKSK
jgi:large subunit ribosomal protein L19e